jgi:hypothetical protein
MLFHNFDILSIPIVQVKGQVAALNVFIQITLKKSD